MKYFDDGSVAYLEMEDFNQNGDFILPINKPLIIMIQGNFCGYCTQMKPIFKQYAAQVSNVLPATIQIDGDKSEQQLGKLITKIVPGYQGVPTVILYNKGKYIKTYEGPRTVEGLLQFSKAL